VDFVLGVLAGIAATVICGAAVRSRRRLQRRHPLTHTLEHIVHDNWSVVLPEGLALPPPPDPRQPDQIGVQQVYGLLHHAGAIDQRTTSYRLVFTNVSDVWLHILDVRVVNAKRTPPIQGRHITCPSAGGNDALVLLFDLDTDARVAWQSDWLGNKLGDTPYFPNHNISLQPGEVFPVELLFTTNTFSCELQLETEIEVDGRRTVVPLLEGDRKIRVTGEPDDGFGERLIWAWHDPENPNFRAPDW